MLQTNCSKVNELFKEREHSLGKIVDYCSLEYLTPAYLNALLTLANFTGYTGQIDFSSKAPNIRSYKNFFVYNIQTTIKDAVLVGNFSYQGYYLNYSNILLPSGNNTISSKMGSCKLKRGYLIYYYFF